MPHAWNISKDSLFLQFSMVNEDEEKFYNQKQIVL